jgi:MerR family transcriptional regulator, activator of bmr gene
VKGKLFGIGELSRIKGITVKALRYYERIGLARPHYVDPATGYRYYSIEQFPQFDLIKAARAMDMSPKDVKAILDKKDNATLLEYLRAQEGLASKKIKELRKTLTMIDAAKTAVGASMAAAPERGAFFKEIPERRVVTESIEPDAGPTEVIIGYASLDAGIEKKGLVSRYETGIIFEGDEDEGFRPSKVFNTVTLAEDSDASSVTSIPAGRFLCVRYSEEDAASQQAKLFAHLRRNRLSPSLMIQADVLDALFAPDSGSAELQVLCRGAPRSREPRL